MATKRRLREDEIERQLICNSDSDCWTEDEAKPQHPPPPNQIIIMKTTTALWQGCQYFFPVEL
jgi:hypothetical protein